LVGLTQNYS